MSHAKITKTFFEKIQDEDKDIINSLTFPENFSLSQILYHYINDDYDCKLGICECGCRCQFLSVKVGYANHCSKECANKSKDRILKIKQTKLERYGDSNYTNIEKCKQTCVERYGVEHPAQSNDIQQKMKQTCLEKYGHENAFQSEEIKEKIKETCLEKYGCEYASQSKQHRESASKTLKNKSEEEKQNIQDKRHATNLEKYGSEEVFIFRSKEWCDNMISKYGDENYNNRDKAKETCLEKYGVESYAQTSEWLDKFKNYEWVQSIIEKRRETNLENFDAEWYFQSDEYKNKYKDFEWVENKLKQIKKSNLEKFGVEWYFQSDECKNILKEKYNDFEWIENKLEQVKRSNLEKFDTEWYFQSDECRRILEEKYKNYEWVQSIKEKRYNTLKKNNTFNTSKIEEQLKSYLNSLGVNYEHQYTSDQYPFNCDFYFPDKDLYVEIQGSWTHGHHPFLGSEEDQQLLEKWKLKNTDYYNAAIDTWTRRDVKKREIAKQNNLNYLEIFSCNLDYCIEQIKKRLEI